MESQKNSNLEWFNNCKFNFYWNSTLPYGPFSECLSKYLRNFELMKRAVVSAHETTCFELHNTQDIVWPEYLMPRRSRNDDHTNVSLKKKMPEKEKKTKKKMIKFDDDNDSISIDNEYLKFYEEGLNFRKKGEKKAGKVDKSFRNKKQRPGLNKFLNLILILFTLINLFEIVKSSIFLAMSYLYLFFSNVFIFLN